MHEGSPRRWPYSANNSPLALPERPILFTPDEVVLLDGFAGGGGGGGGDVSNDGLEAMHSRRMYVDLEQRTTRLRNFWPRPTLHLLSNDDLSCFKANLQIHIAFETSTWGRCLCSRFDWRASAERGLTDWTQGIPIREFTTSLWPAHQVGGNAHIGLATKEQLKLIRDWLDNGVRSTWRPVKLAEGGVRFEHDAELTPPSSTDVEWDGSTERVSLVAPPPTGPSMALDELLVVVHTRQGCYNHRGRIARCVHMHQRQFHEGLFRKGSSHRWNEILTLK